MIEVRNNRDDSHIYDYKGRIFFNVEDPFGYPHHEVEVIGVYDRTASVRDTKTGMTWVVFKKELGLKEKKQAHKYPYHFNRRDCKRKWKGKQDKLINTIKSYSDKGAFERGL
ncbi:hypothetical protein [Ligilactobacillus salivarius]|uniref:hypothetical protein n=1 Tax=Ligilactobacillus salivarius TaxID=1624 RepID=UPI000BEF0637|nr:hypothetical protein CP353_05355 [Lactobacillus sp. UMNPBX2]UXI85242.1 hypothetical protein NYZ94_04960 [Ligilactobacillus salivarius]UXI85312.1 hypothetical protein NYZ94_05320 [Ligilactobacillus salivarius]